MLCMRLDYLRTPLEIKQGMGLLRCTVKKKKKNAFNALSVYYTQAETSRYALKIHYHGSEKNKKMMEKVMMIIQ